MHRWGVDCRRPLHSAPPPHTGAHHASSSPGCAGVLCALRPVLLPAVLPAAPQQRPPLLAPAALRPAPGWRPVLERQRHPALRWPGRGPPAGEQPEGRATGCEWMQADCRHACSSKLCNMPTAHSVPCFPSTTAAGWNATYNALQASITSSTTGNAVRTCCCRCQPAPCALPVAPHALRPPSPPTPPLTWSRPLAATCWSSCLRSLSAAACAAFVSSSCAAACAAAAASSAPMLCCSAVVPSPGAGAGAGAAARAWHPSVLMTACSCEHSGTQG
jgi:hypothetical protein